MFDFKSNCPFKVLFVVTDWWWRVMINKINPEIWFISRSISTCTLCVSLMRRYWTSCSSFGGSWPKDWVGTQTPPLRWRCCQHLCGQSLMAQVSTSKPCCVCGWIIWTPWWVKQLSDEVSTQSHLPDCQQRSDALLSWHVNYIYFIQIITIQTQRRQEGLFRNRRRIPLKAVYSCIQNL